MPRWVAESDPLLTFREDHIARCERMAARVDGSTSLVTGFEFGWHYTNRVKRLRDGGDLEVRGREIKRYRSDVDPRARYAIDAAGELRKLDETGK